MHQDTSSRRQHLSNLYVKHMLPKLQTSSVVNITHTIKQDQTVDRSNSPKILRNLFKFALGLYTKMRVLCSWQETLLSKL